MIKLILKEKEIKLNKHKNKYHSNLRGEKTRVFVLIWFK